jgi:uncharacterized membrane protein YphA (DoxX/SURF4 family)
MDVLAWILTGVLAVVFLGAGLAKLTTPHNKLTANPQMAWATDFSAAQVRGIGAVEVLGAVGLVLPWLLDVAPVLSAVAALGLAGVMVGAALTHRRRGEGQQVVVTLVLATLAVVVAVLRFSQL